MEKLMGDVGYIYVYLLPLALFVTPCSQTELVCLVFVAPFSMFLSIDLD